MQESRMDESFKVLKQNMPRAPEALVERMVKTVNALEAERAKRKTQSQLAMNKQVQKQAGRDMAPKQKKPPQREGPKPMGMG